MEFTRGALKYNFQFVILNAINSISCAAGALKIRIYRHGQIYRFCKMGIWFSHLIKRSRDQQCCGQQLYTNTKGRYRRIGARYKLNNHSEIQTRRYFCHAALYACSLTPAPLLRRHAENNSEKSTSIYIK